MIPKASSKGEKPGLRTVFDKREQNDNTYKLASPLPDIEEILREVSKHKYRSIIDGKDAYEQIRVIPEHVSRTLFTTPDGTMESLVMQQGDSNAGATYQTLMNHVFASYIGVFMFVYLDDIVIFSDSIKEHVEHIKIIFEILRKERLFLSPNKMQFFADELKILGHVIDDKGIRMDPHKVDKVLNWKSPTNKDLLRSFIGAVGFLAPDCKGIRIPMGQLSSLTAEARPWRWDDTAQHSFEEVKRIVDEHRDKRRKALDYSKGADPIYVTTDGCLTGGGGYVSQGKDPESASVVAFWSGKWNAAQQNYPVHEQELLSLVETLKRFRGVLQGTRFVVRTDHKALEYFMRQRDLSPRQHRWIDILSEFDFEIKYIPGDTNKFADALSRIYSDEPKGVVRAESEYINEGEDAVVNNRLRVHPVYVETYLLELMNAITRRSPRLADKPTPRYKETRDRKSRGATHDPEVVLQDTPETVEPLPSPNAIGEESDPDRNVPGSGPTVEVATHVGNRLFEASSNLSMSFPDCIRDWYSEDGFFKPILENPEEFTNFETRDGLILFKSEGIETVAIPDVKVGGRSVREVLIRQGHSILAHLSDEKTATYMRDQVWWKTMIKDITEYCRSCQTCAVSKPQNGKPHGKLKTMPVPTYPWQYVGIDFVGPLPESFNRTGGFDMICVIIDQLTSMVHLVPTKQTYRATDIAELMFEAVYKLHGLPERIISDRDSLFTSKFWKRLHRLLGTELRMSSAFHPQTDGATERANRTMTQMIRQCVSPDQKDWVSKLPGIEFAINSARSSTTGFSPFQLNYGRNPSPMIWRGQEEFPGVRKFAERMKMAVMGAHDSIIAARVTNTVQANRKRAAVQYQVGDLVYLSTKNISMPKGRARKLAPKYLGLFAVTKVLKEGATYQLALSDELLKRGINRSFHASLLKPHVPNDDRRFPGRMPSQIPGFGEKPDEWIVEAIVSHHGKGTRSDFEVQWKAGDRTWAPYREVAHLIAMDRYCELMGVGDPEDLPAAYPKRESISTIAVNVTRVVGSPGIRREGDDQGNCLCDPVMTRLLSQEELIACAAFEHALDQYLRGFTLEPPGHRPPRYPEYLQLVGQTTARQDAPTITPTYTPTPVLVTPAPTQPIPVSMPSESFASILDAQVQMMRMVAGPRRARPNARQPRGPRYPNTTPGPQVNIRSLYNTRGRGMYRGRYGRSRPSHTRRRPVAVEEDVLMREDFSFCDTMALFTEAPGAIAGPSGLSASAPDDSATSALSVSTPATSVVSAMIETTSGLITSYLGSACADHSITEIDLTKRLVSGMEGIGIRNPTPAVEVVELGLGKKGKGVDRDEAPGV